MFQHLNFEQVNVGCDSNIIHSYNGLITLFFSIRFEPNRSTTAIFYNTTIAKDEKH